MSTDFEDGLRARLHAAVDDESGDWFDTDGAIDAAEQAALRRRHLRTAGALAAVVAALAVGVGLGLQGSPRDTGLPAGPAPSGASASPSGAASGPSADPGTFGSPADLVLTATGATYRVQGTDSGGGRFATLTTAEGALLARVPLDPAAPVMDVVHDAQPLALLVAPEPVRDARLGPGGPLLVENTAVRVPGTDRWMTLALLSPDWLEPWPDLVWTDSAGDEARASAPPSVTTVVPGKAGDAGWSAIPVRFTARPSDAGPLVTAERAEVGMRLAAELTLAPGAKGAFQRGDGSGFAEVYGLTTSEPVSVTPQGDTAARFADGWTFATVEVTDGLWATAIRLTGMDDSSPRPLTAISWTDRAGTTHRVEMAS